MNSRVESVVFYAYLYYLNLARESLFLFFSLFLSVSFSSLSRLSLFLRLARPRNTEKLPELWHNNSLCCMPRGDFKQKHHSALLSPISPLSPFSHEGTHRQRSSLKGECEESRPNKKTKPKDVKFQHLRPLECSNTLHLANVRKTASCQAASI